MTTCAWVDEIWGRAHIDVSLPPKAEVSRDRARDKKEEKKRRLSSSWRKGSSPASKREEKRKERKRERETEGERERMPCALFPNSPASPL